MKSFKLLIASAIFAFASVAQANTLTVDFGGVYGGTLDYNAGDDIATGTDINISTLTIQDDNGTAVYDVQGGLLNFDTSAAGFEVTITGGVSGLTTPVVGGSTLFEGSFTSWSFTDGLTDVFFGNGSGTVGADVLANTVSADDNPFAFTGFSLESVNGDVLSTDFLMTATGERTPEVPIPAAAWLFGSGLLGLVGVARRKPLEA